MIVAAHANAITFPPPTQGSFVQTPGTDAVQTPGTEAPGTAEQMVPPDNSKKNVRDKNKKNPTPMAQGGSAQDIKITKDIRKAITDNKDVSTNGKNVKIITQNGMVTLRGPVASDKEKQLIYDIASKVAGPTQVNNQMEVK